LLASVASREPDNLRRQQQDGLRLAGASPEESERHLAAFEAWMEGVSSGKYQTYEDYFGSDGLPEPFRTGQEVNPIPPMWLRQAMEYDQLATLSSLRLPILALSGTHDWMVPPSETALIEDTLRQAGHPDFTAEVFPGLDHRFAAVASPDESFQMSVEPDKYYQKNAYPITSDVLEAILTWLEANP
jgi:hypothetical protein